MSHADGEDVADDALENEVQTNDITEDASCGEGKTPARACDSSNMDVLLRMGFPKDRAEKALSCTGDVSVQAAIDWILAHKDDPQLDVHDQREYLIYLCPSGPLLEKVEEFLTKTAEVSGRNGAHLHMPHITMCHAFKTDAANIPAVLKAMEGASAALSDKLPATIKLDRYTSESFMGLFLDNHAEKALKEYSQSLITALHSLAEKAIPFNAEKAFHLTLAYHFEASQYEAILALTKRVPLKTTAQWHFLLLSRDTSFHSHEVFKMVHPWSNSPHREDELAYTKGDYVYIAPKPHHTLIPNNNAHPSGWIPAVSWTTGRSGVVPRTGVEHAATSDVWILHGLVPYGSQSALPSAELAKIRSYLPVFPPAQRAKYVPVGAWETEEKEVHYSETFAKKLDKYGVGQDGWHHRHQRRSSGADGGKTNGAAHSTATVYVMRHGERMDFVFGVDWIHKCFDGEGNFTRTDLNMPVSVPKRRAGPSAYIRDPPLTALGVFQAQSTGRAMKDAGITFNRVYVSPALRSIQTAAGVLDAFTKEGEKSPVKLCIEPGLYEWLGWVSEARPDWLTATDLAAAGYPVDADYKPKFAAHHLDFNEDVEGFYARNGLVVRRVMEKYGHEGGNFLFVAHASSLDTCTRQLTGGVPRSHYDMNRVTVRVPYCAVVQCAPGPDKSWSLHNPPFPPMTHGHNIKFNAIQTLVSSLASSAEHPDVALLPLPVSGKQQAANPRSKKNSPPGSRSEK